MAVLAVFPRLYTSDLDGTRRALAASGVDRVRLKFAHVSGLQIVLIDDVLVLAGPPEVLEPFRSTALTLIVDDLDAALRAATAARAEVLRGPAEQPTGRNATVRFPAAEGLTIEYVEWNAQTRAEMGV